MVFEDFEYLCERLELFEDDSEMWNYTVEGEMPYLLNDLDTGLRELKIVEDKQLIPEEELWEYITLEHFEQVLEFMTELGVNQDEYKTSLARTGHDPSEADLFQFFMGYSIDGTKDYAWVDWTEEDWDSVPDEVIDDILYEYDEDWYKDEEWEDYYDDDDWAYIDREEDEGDWYDDYFYDDEDFDLEDYDWETFDWDSYDDEELNFEKFFLEEENPEDMNVGFEEILFAQLDKKKRNDLTDLLADITHDIIVIQPPFVPVEEGKKKKKRRKM